MEGKQSMAEKIETKKTEKKNVPVEEGLFTMPDSPEGFHLLGSKCQSCGTAAFPAKKRCVKCFSDKIEIAPLSSTGEVATWTVIRMEPFGYKGKVPYILAEVKLAEGLHIRTQLSGIDPEKPQIKIGDKVESFCEKIYTNEAGNDVYCYKFKKF
jgi:uncharacterized protein